MTHLLSLCGSERTPPGRVSTGHDQLLVVLHHRRTQAFACGWAVFSRQDRVFLAPMLWPIPLSRLKLGSLLRSRMYQKLCQIFAFST